MRRRAEFLAPLSRRSALEHLARVLERDGPIDDAIRRVWLLPQLAANVLAMANSPPHASSMPIDRVDRAVILLGRATLATVVAEMLAQPDALWLPAFDAAAFDEHLIANSIAAEVVANAAKIPLRAEARTAALLHDIGLQLIAQRDAEGLERSLQASFAQASRAVEHERYVLGTDHCEAAAQWMNRAGIRGALADAVDYHHDPLASPRDHRYLTMIVYAGECLARRAGFGDLCGEEVPALEWQVLAELRLGVASLDATVPILKERIDALGLQPSPSLEGQLL